jgi:hypothetical protein
MGEVLEVIMGGENRTAATERGRCSGERQADGSEDKRFPELNVGEGG